jgi:hypothetical protein
VNDALAMKVSLSLDQLLGDPLDFFLRQGPIILKNFEKFPLCKFCHDTKLPLCFKVVEHSNDILVVHVSEDRYLLPQIFQILLCLPMLANELHRDALPSALPASFVDPPKGSLAYPLQAVIVLHRLGAWVDLSTSKSSRQFSKLTIILDSYNILNGVGFCFTSPPARMIRWILTYMY